MLEAPDVQGAHIIECLETEYGLSTTEIAFLPLGADVNTAVYRVVAEDGVQYFLKLRRGDFHSGVVTIPYWLAKEGMEPLIAPIATRATGALWTHLDTFTVILYPFVTGKSGWEMELSHQQWKEVGEGLNALHSSVLPPELARPMPREEYAAVWRDRVTAFLEQAANQAVNDPVAAKLVEFLEEKRTTIRHIIMRARRLANILVQQPPDNCLCHGDPHAGNILVDTTNRLYIVDWDTLILAPKERDLMFIGGGVGGVWNRGHEVEWFYQGYGQSDINLTALTYYRYERIVQDIGEMCAGLLTTSGGIEDRVVMLEQFTSQFELANVVDMACATDRRLQAEK